MNSQMVGLLVNVGGNFMNASTAVQNRISHMQQGMLSVGKSIKTTFLDVIDSGYVTRALLGVSALMYTTQKFVDMTTDAYIRQSQALDRLGISARTWGQSQADALAQTHQLYSGGGLTLAGSADAMSGLLQARYSPRQAENLLRLLRDRAAVSRPNGMSVEQAVVQAAQGIAHGSASGLDALGLARIEQNMKLVGSGMEDLTNPWRQSIGRAALNFVLMRQLMGTEGEFARKSLTDIAVATDNLKVKTKQLSATIGEELKPLLLDLALRFTALIDRVTVFVQAHPMLVQWLVKTVVVVSILATAMLSLSAAIGTVYKLLPLFAPLLAKTLPILSFTTKETFWADVAAIFKDFFPVLLRMTVAFGIFFTIIKENFLGSRDIIVGWWEKIKAIFLGLKEGVASMQGTTVTFSRTTYLALQKAGVFDFVATLLGIIYNLKLAWAQFKEGFSEALVPIKFVFYTILEGFDMLINAITGSKRHFHDFSSWMWTAKLLGVIVAAVLSAMAFNAIVAAGAMVIAGISAVIAWSPVIGTILAVVVAVGVLYEALKGIVELFVLLKELSSGAGIDKSFERAAQAGRQMDASVKNAIFGTFDVASFMAKDGMRKQGMSGPSWAGFDALGKTIGDAVMPGRSGGTMRTEDGRWVGGPEGTATKPTQDDGGVWATLKHMWEARKAHDDPFTKQKEQQQQAALIGYHVARALRQSPMQVTTKTMLDGSLLSESIQFQNELDGVIATGGIAQPQVGGGTSW